VVVAVISVGMVQVPIHEVIDVIAVRYRRVPTARTMDVVFVVSLTVVGDAPGRIGVGHRDDMLVVVRLMSAMKMPVVEVSNVVPMFHSDVTAAGPVLMFVVLVDGVSHGLSLPKSGMNGCGRISMVQHISDERLYMGVRQPVEDVATIASARDQVLV